jgi:hypothetical protein
MLLKYYKAAGQSRPVRHARLSGPACLPGCVRSFSYWSHGKPSIVLTAYALRFLADANAFIDVDPDVTQQAKKWLMAEQGKSAIGI